jgi:hypothetical protein
VPHPQNAILIKPITVDKQALIAGIKKALA